MSSYLQTEHASHEELSTDESSIHHSSAPEYGESPEQGRQLDIRTRIVTRCNSIRKGSDIYLEWSGDCFVRELTDSLDRLALLHESL